MAHGDKKWIVAFDGKIKRSNDRTKKDYYRDVKWWDEYDYAYSPRYRYSKKDKKKNDPNFCPQCKHVQKHIRDIEVENKAHEERLRVLYDAECGAANAAWKAHREARRNVHWEYGWYPRTEEGKLQLRLKLSEIKTPKLPEPPSFIEWAAARGESLPHMFRQFDIRSYLCYKHEEKYDAKREMWHHPLGQNENYQWMRKAEYNYYRREVKNLMRQERYDDIPKHKKGWLD